MAALIIDFYGKVKKGHFLGVTPSTFTSEKSLKRLLNLVRASPAFFSRHCKATNSEILHRNAQ